MNLQDITSATTPASTSASNDQKAFSRRDFLVALGAASAGVITAAVPARGSAAGAAPGAKTVQDPLSLASLESQVGSRFTMKTEKGTVTAVLKTVEEGQSSRDVQQYSAVFEIESGYLADPKQSPLAATAQDHHTYSVKHKTLGEFPLALIGSSRDGVGMLTASFCQLMA